MGNGDSWMVGIANRMNDEIENGAAPSPERLTVRELLSKYNFLRRGDWINSQIRNQLEELNLRAIPDFEHTWLDATISIELEPPVAGEAFGGKRPDPNHRIDSLDAAHNEPMTAHPDHPLSSATTVMQFHDYSQLPVMDNPHTVKGIISWQSIGTRLALGKVCEHVRDCMETPAVEIPKDTTLFEAIGVVAENGYVLVRDRENGNVISGIVTASDLAEQFVQLASPFLLTGEIEGHLRNLIHRKFTIEELRDHSSGQGGKTIRGSADLTLGEYCRLLENTSNWERLGLKMDRGQFVQHLNSVREIRNNIMHFNPEGLSDEDTKTLRDVARFFNDLVRMGAI